MLLSVCSVLFVTVSSLLFGSLSFAIVLFGFPTIVTESFVILLTGEVSIGTTLTTCTVETVKLGIYDTEQNKRVLKNTFF